MKKIKISDSEARLLFLLLALIFLAGSYFLVFNKCTTRAQEIRTENEQNEKIVEQLEAMVNRQAEVEAETAACDQLVEEIKAKYPSMVTTEKAIAIIQDMEDVTEVHISNISFLMNNLIGDISSYGTGTDAAGGTASQVGYYDALSMNYEADYDSFKEMAAYISGLEDRMTMPAITAAYDNESGMISGTVTVNMYYLTGTGREYEPPVTEGISSGVSDIFLSGGNGVRRSTGNSVSDGETASDETEDEENGEETSESGSYVDQ
jgi:hypothetical protein